MKQLVIIGGRPLKGRVSLLGAKNASLKLLIASLLTDKECLLENVPAIGDIETTRQIIKELGGRVKRVDKHVFCLANRGVSSWQVPFRLGERSRSSSMFIAPLLARFGQAKVPYPGGDRIGKRPLGRHLEGFRAMGAKVEEGHRSLLVRAKKLKGTDYRFPKNTHTGTESLLMAAVLAEGKTVLRNAAAEPEVDDLIAFLNKMGAKIKRVKPRRLEIEGVSRLGEAKHRLMPDRNEAVTFACVGLATKGEVLVQNAREEHLAAFLAKLKEIGAGYQKEKEGLRFFYQGPLEAVQVTTAPHPGFMTDWQPLWTTLMTQARGKSIVHETIFENRFGYVPFLQKMGAKIEYFNPPVAHPEEVYNFNLADDQEEYFHALRIWGPRPLKGAEIKVPNIRAGATLLLAALIAQGQTTLSDIEHIDRGYENLDRRLRKLGAKIKRIKI